MCDEFTAIEEEAALARGGITRRNFAAASGALALTACATTGENAGAGALREQAVSFATPDGTADGFFVHPARGRHPGVILWPDIAGLRDAYRIMARRLAGHGYAVLVINQYYRSAPAPILNSIAEWRTPEGQARLKPMIERISSPDATVRDARAAVAFLDGQGAVDRARGIATSGYCMGGPFTVRSAWAVPDRIRAAASFHGGGLVTDKPDSPHRLLAQTRAAYLIAVARNDDARAPGDKDAFRAAAAAAGRPAEVEVYPADHGWCTIDAPVYNQVEADRAWARMLALFAGL